MIGRVVGRAPVTSIFLLSCLGFMASASLVSDPGLAMVAFYLFALPYYITTLVVTVVGYEMGVRLGIPAAVALCAGLDLTISIVRLGLNRRSEVVP